MILPLNLLSKLLSMITDDSHWENTKTTDISQEMARIFKKKASVEWQFKGKYFQPQINQMFTEIGQWGVNTSEMSSTPTDESR